jgi:hypothetical protein
VVNGDPRFRNSRVAHTLKGSPSIPSNYSAWGGPIEVKVRVMV